MITEIVAAIAVAFALTVIELTEVVVLVFALGAEHGTIRHGALGAVAGLAVVGVAALATGAAILRLPHEVLLWTSAVLLFGFGVFLFRSTLRTYRREQAARAGTPPPPRSHAGLQFAGGFAIGAVEATEVVVVLLALTAAGEGAEAVAGAVLAGVLLVAATALVHEQIRRIKSGTLKAGATGILFAFATFWLGEAIGLRWPGGDLVLLPLFAVAFLVVRGTLAVALRPSAAPSAST